MKEIRLATLLTSLVGAATSWHLYGHLYGLLSGMSVVITSLTIAGAVKIAIRETQMPEHTIARGAPADTCGQHHNDGSNVEDSVVC